MVDPHDLDQIDAAYAASADVLSNGASVRRRRAAVLAAARTQASGIVSIEQPPRPAPTVVNAKRSHWWNALAAACVIGFSSLLVLRLNDASAPVEASRAPDPATAASPSKPEPAAIGAAESAAITPPSVAEKPAAPTRAPPTAPVDSRPRRTEPFEPSAKRDAATAPSPPAATQIASPQPAPVLRDAATAAPRPFPQRAEVSPRPPQQVDDAATSEAPEAMRAPQQQLLEAPARRSANDASSAPAPATARAGSSDQAKAVAAARPAWRSDGLIAAVEAGDLDRIRQLLQSAPADAERGVDGRSALVHAVLRSNLPAVELLNAAGADSRLADRQGKTALDHAIAIGNPAILEALQRR